MDCLLYALRAACDCWLALGSCDTWHEACVSSPHPCPHPAFLAPLPAVDYDSASCGVHYKRDPESILFEDYYEAEDCKEAMVSSCREAGSDVQGFPAGS